MSRLLPPLTLRRRIAERTWCRVRKIRASLACLIARTIGVSRAERARAEAGIAAFRYRPVISIILTVPHGDPDRLAGTLSSVTSQIYQDWQLCIAVPAENVQDLQSLLVHRGIPGQKARVAACPGPWDPATAAAAALQNATGEYFLALSPGDCLDCRALYRLLGALQEEPVPGIVFSDEAGIGVSGLWASVIRKPGFSRDLLLSTPYFGRLLAFRTMAVRQAGGIRSGTGAAWEYDLALGLAAGGQGITRIPSVLYYSRGRDAGPGYAPPGGEDPYLQVLRDHIARTVPGATAVPGCAPGTFRVRRRISGEPLVSLIIPTKDRLDLLEPCIHSICTKTTYPCTEILIVDNRSSEPATRDYLSRIASEHGNIRVIPYDKPFHPAAIKNTAARNARGEYLLFLNNDIEVISPGWIEALLEQAQRREVACAGAKLLYPDGTVQHAGIVMGSDGAADHLYRFADGDCRTGPQAVSCIRNYRMLTGACMLIRRNLLEELGWFDEGYRAGFGDLDLCMQAASRGYLNVYTPYALLCHHESASLAFSPAAGFYHEDRARFSGRWEAELATGDPCYHPHLPFHDFCLKYP